MADNTEWIEIGDVVGDTGPKGDTGDTGIGTTIKGHYNTYQDLVNAHPRSTGEDAYIINGEIYYWNVNDNKWESGGSIKGDTGDTGIQGVKGDTGDTGSRGSTGEKGDTGAGLAIKGSYDSYEDLVNNHPTGSDGECYLVNGSLYVWSGSAWQNVGNIKGEKGDVGVKGDTGDTGFSPRVNVDHDTGVIVITTDDGSSTISFDELKGDTGPQGSTGAKGDTGFSPSVSVDHDSGVIVIVSEEGSSTISFDELKGDTGIQGVKGDTGDTGPQGSTGAKGDTGPKGDTGEGSDEESGWKLPVDEILTTSTLPTGVSKGYRVAICTSSLLAIKEYNGSSWDTENLDAYSVIPLKHSGGIQMYLAKSTGPVYMGVEYGIFGKFRFMTQATYDALSSYDEDTIYFVRS